MHKIMLATLLLLALAGQALAYPRYYQYREPERYAVNNSEGYDTSAPNDVAFRIGLFGNLGYSGYAMTDENNYIDELNASSALFGGKSLDHIIGGLTGGIGMTFGFSDFFQLGLEYEGLSAQTEGPLAPSGNYSNANYVITHDTTTIPASESGCFIKFLAPIEDRWLLSFGLGLYSLWIDSDTEKRTFADGSSDSYTFNGSTVATKIWVGGEYFFTRHLSLGLDAGYRFARIDEITDQYGTTVYNGDGSNFTLDYSGPFSRATLQFYF
jgi:hypothetical protein